MVKSFQTSGGTVLSTNWDEVCQGCGLLSCRWCAVSAVDFRSSSRQPQRRRDSKREISKYPTATAAPSLFLFFYYALCLCLCVLLGGQGRLREGAPGAQGDGVEDVGGRKAAPEGR